MSKELLVRVVDKVNKADPAMDPFTGKAGDVIAWKPAGSEWGVRELTNPEWRIIKCDLTDEQANALVSPEIPLTKDQPIRKRGVKLDVTQLDTLSAGAVTAQRKGSLQAKKGEDAIVAPTSLLAIVQVKPALKSPDVIGPVGDVIGK